MLSQKEPFEEDPIRLGTAMVVVAAFGGIVLKEVAGAVGKRVFSTLKRVKDNLTDDPNWN